MSHLKMEVLSQSQDSTNSYRQVDGVPSLISKWEIPSSLILVKLKTPAKNGRRLVILESQFKTIYLERKMTETEVRSAYPALSKNVWVTTMHYYKEFYPDEIAAVRSGHHRNSMLGNTRGAGTKKSIPLKVLSELLSKGYTLQKMADTLNVAPQTIKKNLVEYGLVANTVARQHLKLTGQAATLRHLDQYAPGIEQAAENYMLSPMQFYDQLYLAFCRVSKLLWSVQDMKHRAYHRLTTEEKETASHISWNNNRAELTLSLALLDAGIQHARQHVYYQEGKRSLMADFYFPQWDLIVEVDGSVHEWESTKEKDRMKDNYFKRTGKKFLRLSAKEVIKNTELAIQRIAEAGLNL